MTAVLTRFFDSLWYGGNPLAYLFWPVAFVYGTLMRARRAAYRRGWLRTIEPPVPVVVVGNLTAGGTGKTPLVIWLAEAFTARGFAVGIVTRGYRGRAAEWPLRVEPDSDAQAAGDEAVLLAARTRCPVMAGPDRVAALERLAAQQMLDVVLADDGLQHLRLGRTVELAVVDGARGLGNGLCLPAGPLREPPERLRDVDAIVVNGGRWGHSGVFRMTLAAERAIRVGGTEARPLAAFAASPVHAVAGIGHPERFFRLLEDADLEVLRHPLPDHAVIGADDLSFDDGLPVLITEKDAVKCGAIAHPNLWCVPVEVELAPGHAERLLALLLRILEGVRS